MNALFPFSVTVGTIGIACLYGRVAAATSEAETAGIVMLLTMLTLAVIEHWVLILPIPFAKLWSWALTLRPARSRTRPHATAI